jgi:hypothetical protein
VTIGLKTRITHAVAIVAALTMVDCRKPGVETLRDAFAQQLASNKFIKDFHRNGDVLEFSGPGADGVAAKWRVHIDSAVVVRNDDRTSNPETQPYKGVVKSSWYWNGQLVQPSGRDSNLPVELISNGLSQDCWAFWVKEGKRWSWE